MSFEWNVEICAFLCIPDHIILITILIVICIVMGVEKTNWGVRAPCYPRDFVTDGYRYKQLQRLRTVVGIVLQHDCRT